MIKLICVWYKFLQEKYPWEHKYNFYKILTGGVIRIIIVCMLSYLQKLFDRFGNILEFIWYCSMMEFAGRGAFYLCAGENLKGVLCVMNFAIMFYLIRKWAKEEKQKRLQEKSNVK